MKSKNGAIYLEKNSKVKKLNGSVIKTASSITLVFIFSILSIFSLINVGSNSVAKADTTQGPAEWVVCNYFKDNALAQFALKIKDTSDFEYLLNSKSSVSSGFEDVSTYPMNLMIGWSSGTDYKKNNEDILGRDLYYQQDAPDKNKFNKGNKLNPYDRFGVAGLVFTSYRGEWKYVTVDPCSPNSQPTDPKLSVFYEGRLAPLSVYEDIPTSKDPRTKQFDNSIALQLWFSYVNTFSNWTFGVTKFIVALAITLINLSFTNISTLLGIDKFLAGTDSSSKTSIFYQMYNNLYIPLMVIAFAMTGLYMLWKGIIKRQYREAINTLFRSLGMLLIGTIILVKPLLFVSLPNNIVVLIQSTLASSMSTSIAGGNGMCATDSGIKSTNIFGEFGTNVEKNAEVFDQASKNMESALGCSLWQQFLLKPYSEGQFGTDWNNLWAKNKVPGWAGSNATAINNTDNNAKMVGDATVPLGAGTVMNNWVIFQISTQTNAHSPIGKDGDYSQYSNGVANDWWRIADAFSNYEEKQVQSGDASYAQPVENSVLPQWDNWNGNNQLSRWLTANASVLVALIGLLAPVFFAAFCAIYGLGISILMAFAPLMLLLACWPGRGWQIFTDWGKLLLRTVVRKLVMGVLLILSITFTATFIQIMEKENWWLGITLMALFSLFLIRNKDRVLDAFLSSSNMLQSSMSGGASQLTGQLKGTMSTGKRIAGIGAAATVGGVSSKRKGGSFISGAKAGTRSDLRMLASKNHGIRTGLLEYDLMKQNKRIQERLEGKEDAYQEDSLLPGEEDRCTKCGNQIYRHDQAMFDGVGWWCMSCGEEQQRNANIDMVTVDIKSKKELDETNRKKPKDVNGVWQSYDAVPQLKDQVRKVRVIKEKKKNGENITTEEKDLLDNNSNRLKVLKESIGQTANFMNEAEKIKSQGIRVRIGKIPNEIRPFLGNLDHLNDEFNKGNYEYVQTMFIYAWINWYQEQTGENLNDEQINPGFSVNEENMRTLIDTRKNDLKVKEERKNNNTD